MVDDDEVRNAFRSMAVPEHTPATDVLESVRPRLRRARLVRRVTMFAATLSTLAIVGLGVAALQRDPGPEGRIVVVGDHVGSERPTVSTPDDEFEQPPPDPRTPRATPPSMPIVDTTPTPTAAPVAPPTAASSETAVDRPTATPTPLSVLRSPPDPERTAGPTPTASPTSTPAPTPPDSFPQQSPTSVPTATPGRAVEIVVIRSPGGDVTVHHTSAAILDIEPDPAPGFTSEIEKQEATEAKVIFAGPGREVEIEIHLEGGRLRHELADEGADGTDS